MEVIKNLLTRLRHTGVLILIGFLLIIYIALGFLYLQQGTQQRELDKEIAKLSLVLAKPLPSKEELQAEYDEVNHSLVPMADSAVIAILVSIAENSGIDVDPDSVNFRVPPAAVKEEKVGGGTYQVLSFRNISVQADYAEVMAFILAVDSGTRLETMVLKKADIKPVTVKVTGAEGARREEFRNVASAVIEMMDANGLSAIPAPLDYASGTASDDMDAFPNITTTAAGKDYTGTNTPRDGYVLYQHDRINPTDTTVFTTVSYVTVAQTEYYYTCEADGTVRQWDGPDVATATEYLTSEEMETETIASLDIDIYTKPEG